MKQIHLLISGKVQGVFFRAYAKGKAKELSLTGWVKNLEDGRVEILAQGKEGELEDFRSWCYKGSPKSKVEKVEFTFNEISEDLYKGFQII